MIAKTTPGKSTNGLTDSEYRERMGYESSTAPLLPLTTRLRKFAFRSKPEAAALISEAADEIDRLTLQVRQLVKSSINNTPP